MTGKNLKKRLEILFVLIFASSCAKVQIHDDLWCIDAGKYGAECFNTISNKEKTLNKYEWDKLRVGQVCSATESPGKGYSNIKNAIEKLCADTRFCTAEQKEMIKNIAEKVDSNLKKGKGSDPFTK